MTREDYLRARGWWPAAQPSNGWWFCPVADDHGKAADGTDYFAAEEAERIQLDRDAAVRDYVNARRPAPRCEAECVHHRCQLQPGHDGHHRREWENENGRLSFVEWREVSE